MLVTAWNGKAGIQIPKGNEEVLIRETKFRWCCNIWYQSCVCVRVWWQRVSVPPSLRPMSKPGLHKACGRKSWEVRLVISSRGGVLWGCLSHKSKHLRWEVRWKREQQPCGWDGKAGRHCLRWPVQVLQLLKVHTLSCLAFSGLALDLKLWMYDENLFCSCHLACCFPMSLLRLGDSWWLLESFACWITFVNSFCSLKYLLLLQQPDCDTSVHYRKECGPVEWVDSSEVADLPQAHFRNCSVLHWSLICILPMQDYVSGKAEEVSRCFRCSF